MGDRRSVRTKTAIKKAFLILLRDKTISKITISEISELADIGRGTFYSHYQDIYDLYGEVETEMFEQFNRFYDESFPLKDRRGIVHFITRLTGYIYQNRALFLVLTNPEDTLLTSDKIRHFFKGKIFKEMLTEDHAAGKSTALKETESLFIASGVFGVIKDWIIGGMKEEPAGMSMRIEKLLLKLEE